MMAVTEWKGIFPALTTPFTANDTIDVALFSKNIHAQLAAGVNGLIVGGSLGEAAVLTLDEKQILLQTAAAVSNRTVPVLLNIAAATINEAIQQVELGTKNFVSGFMLLPPMRYKSDERETIYFLKTVAEATSLPIMLYNNPVDYGTEITIEILEALEPIANIVAIKESTRNVTNVSRLKNHFGNRFSILCGVDTIAAECFMMGADGWVAGLVNAFPKETVALYQLVKAKRYDEAVALHRWFLPLLELDIHPKLVQYIKLAQMVTGLGSTYVRAPRLVPEGAEYEQLLQLIHHAIATHPGLPKF
ncbi:dihydrodipicolinate synthase family protein [Hydrotalea sp.]|uniref:dihydrodipicolinate synthase family protein n=1 Tax=Hydrotalea sp. TaxID=2881279 RepID=UPI002584CF2D|nr:dihydrodipicolinate synthase family protein [Hydrotalea sp.]